MEHHPKFQRGPGRSFRVGGGLWLSGLRVFILWEWGGDRENGYSRKSNIGLSAGDNEGINNGIARLRGRVCHGVGKKRRREVGVVPLEYPTGSAGGWGEGDWPSGGLGRLGELFDHGD